MASQKWLAVFLSFMEKKWT